MKDFEVPASKVMLESSTIKLMMSAMLNSAYPDATVVWGDVEGGKNGMGFKVIFSKNDK